MILAVHKRRGRAERANVDPELVHGTAGLDENTVGAG